jgi:CheY-like chemotaxis protein
MSKPTILVIDDDNDSREMVCEWLRQHGYDCIGAEDGREGMARLEDLPQLSLILLDLMMPGMSGWQFRSKQQAHGRYGHVPVVVLTAHANPHGESGALKADAVMRKPLDLKALLGVVAHHAMI